MPDLEGITSFNFQKSSIIFRYFCSNEKQYAIQKNPPKTFR